MNRQCLSIFLVATLLVLPVLGRSEIVTTARGVQMTPPAVAWQRLATIVIDWLMPPAYADELIASDPDPRVILDDTDSAFSGPVDFILGC